MPSETRLGLGTDGLDDGGAEVDPDVGCLVRGEDASLVLWVGVSSRESSRLRLCVWFRDRGVSIAQASRDLDVHENVLRKWAKDLASDPAQAFPGHGTMKPEQAEIERLRREVQKLKAGRDRRAHGLRLSLKPRRPKTYRDQHERRRRIDQRLRRTRSESVLHSN